MRKQYHFRPSDRGLRAWDVDRLIALTRELPRVQVPISAIRELDEPYWSTGYDAPLTCRDMLEHLSLIEQADLGFPIILSSDGRVMDGMHRVAKALMRGEQCVEAVRFTEESGARLRGC